VSVEEERQARTEAITEQARILRAQWPTLLRRLRQIPDPRQPKKVKHALTSLMLYGILTFVLHYSSRREANKEITRPQFEQNLLALFPELESLPHADTLFRLLRDLGSDVEQIEQAQVELLNQLIRKKKFKRYLINNCYPIAIDGSRKITCSDLWSDKLLQQRIPGPQGEDEKRYQYYVYVLEASLCFHNGMVIPLMSQFLDYQQGDTERDKQDCETRAFHRLAKRIKKAFPRLPIMLLLDGLYASAPVMCRCRRYHWQFMIVLQEKCLSTVWEEYRSLLSHQPSNQHQQQWGKRQQHFRWINDIRYEYGTNARQYLNLHLVVCQEQWQAVDQQGQTVTQHATHAWISSRSLQRENVHARCNLGARYRWGIEAGFLVEKHQGYHYEHAFAKEWNAMRGYHYLMRLAHFLNTLARYASTLAAQFRDLGVRGFIRFVRETYSGPWLNANEVTLRMQRAFQLRFT